MPDITVGALELAYLQEQIKSRGQETTSVPVSMALESVPLDERSNRLQIERMVFPTLFPTGVVSLMFLGRRPW